MAKQLQHIYPICGPNLGGLCFARVIPVDNVVFIPDAVGGIVQQEIQLADPGNYADVFFPMNEGSFEEQQAQDEHGVFFKPKLKFFIPQDSPELYEVQQALTGIKAIAIYQDNNGYTKIVGSKEYPITFSTDLATGRRTRDANGIDMVLSGESPDRALFYLHQVMVPAGTRKVFSAAFSFGFRRK